MKQQESLDESLQKPLDERFNLLLHKAVFDDDWNSLSEIFEEHPARRTDPVNDQKETPLMFAVGTNRSHRFVKSLVSDLSRDGLINQALAERNYQGDTALHYAATVGNVTDFTLLVSSSSKPVELAFNYKNNYGRTPLFVAAYQGKRNKMLEFLFSRLRVLNPPISGIPDRSLCGGDLLGPAIEGEFIDIALKLVKEHSEIILSKGWNIQRALDKLARNPKFFRSGSGLGFFGHLIYSLLPVHESKIVANEKTTTQRFPKDEESIYTTAKEFYHRKCTSEAWFKRILRYIASPIMNIYDMKVTHTQANQLVQCLCENAVKRCTKEFVFVIFGSTMSNAVRFETLEVIEEIIRASPSIIDSILDVNNAFDEAIKRRQYRTYNLLYQITSYRMLIASRLDDDTNENMLQIVAKTLPSRKFTNHMGGAALQMQHELQWFKEIESNLVEPSYKEELNRQGKTPRMVFSEVHESLLTEGRDWMKAAADSSSTVAALIVTVAFAAAFTVPGGNKSEGKPVYLDNGSFMLFIISDAVALFSSVTSVLMFLGILTSRYAEEDFLYTLPTKMTIGLISLFLSLAAMIVAFSATLSVVLQDKVRWIAAPLLAIACIPVGVFGVLQFPLLVRLINSTFGPSIFHKQNRRMLH
ncbi:hypothetical protein OSB04_009990 [Centaurea solstitialis]|uniref:PGG domain-containing protein n=1 Tax=Centaurea solstitialis TaxID=347529 RepID=A0AA38TJV1_9ASTR|nr:hypothetical protein OSB04_009990 [Centaurea solstitialis]